MAKPTASTPKAKRLVEIWVVETKKDALAIADHRGEILKFIGDGLLAIFPLAAFEAIADAAMNAAHEALAAVHAIEHESLGSELLKMVVALHYGTVIYGDIGAACSGAHASWSRPPRSFANQIRSPGIAQHRDQHLSKL